eukprot:GILJ01010736.1.p1 GENE.GILJ01010736.1~~GILJ01010736.1.p1  ORF type:complete len:259 (-),score=23.82 GILJ01010736.1:238-972(-)
MAGAWPPNTDLPLLMAEVHTVLQETEVEILEADQLSYRTLQPTDMEEVKALHSEWFPIRYDQSFFDSAASGKILSLAATQTIKGGKEIVVGLITVQIGSELGYEDSNAVLRCSLFELDRQLAYILTLGVIPEYRRKGVASLLLQKCVEMVKRTAPTRCKAVYLHVVAYNSSAISFYERNKFILVRRLEEFYNIKGQRFDAFLYAVYINGGQPPFQWSEVWDCVARFGQRTSSIFDRFRAKPIAH